jgi:uncharacterized protein (DUF2235 family)
MENNFDLAIAWYDLVDVLTSPSSDISTRRNFEKVILAGYRWLSEKYEPGDKIFLFGIC